MRLYTGFYHSDIIMCSPLGLRTIIGDDGDAGRDFDFLSSVEILVLDSCEMLQMVKMSACVRACACACVCADL